MSKLKLAAAVACCAFVIVASGQQEKVASWTPLSGHSKNHKMDARTSARYQAAIQATAAMANDPNAAALARARGLDVLNLTWEDTGRYKNSAVGPNISDMTIQVGYGQKDIGVNEVKCMPVIRYPNFSDKTCDIDPSDFTLLVGNEHGKSLRRVSLRDFLEHPTEFLSKPGSWLGNHKSLLAARDSKVLVSAQACFLPIPKEGLATFNPVLFNYLSMSGDPAVLTILATREGTSTTIIDNVRDSFSEGSTWGQRLFHNQNGERASLTGQRLSDFHPANGEVSSGPGLNMVLLIQVPLKQRYVARGFKDSAMLGGAAPMPATKAAEGAKSDMEAAVIGHGDIEGPYTEIANLPIQRDPNFPVRVTVQFYQATSNGVVSGDDMDAIQHAINSVYDHGENVGSLVVDGETGRPTEYVGCKAQPANWWGEFWQRYEANTGMSRDEATRRLRHMLGKDYFSRPVSDLYIRDLLRSGK